MRAQCALFLLSVGFVPRPRNSDTASGVSAIVPTAPLAQRSLPILGLWFPAKNLNPVIEVRSLVAQNYHIAFNDMFEWGHCAKTQEKGVFCNARNSDQDLLTASLRGISIRLPRDELLMRRYSDEVRRRNVSRGAGGAIGTNLEPRLFGTSNEKKP